MKNTHDCRLAARTAILTASDDDGDETTYTFSGIAVAAGDVLHMDDGTRVLFTADELSKSAETQADEPLSVDHPADDDGRPQYPPPTDETVGRVPKAGWIADQEAVGYEATTHDEDIATGVRAGSYDVSVHPTFDLGEYVEEYDAYRATNITFRDLSVVSKGDSPSNTVEWGSNQALASFTASNSIGDAIDAGATSASSADGTGAFPRQSLVSSAVHGTLQALGIAPNESGVDLEGDAGGDGGDDEQHSNEGAESSADTTTATDMDRETTIETLVDEHGLSEGALSEMEDDDLETLQSSLDDGTDTPDDPSGSDGSTNDDTPTLAEMTVDDLADGLKQRGFVTEDGADEFVQEAQAKASKSEKVDELIAKDDELDEENRDELMASADSLIDSKLKQVRGELAAQMPRTSGVSSSLTATASDDDELEEYGTGVQED